MERPTSNLERALVRAALPAKLLVGVSGGPDSVALLDGLVKQGHRPHICHLNHKLRGAESDADAKFVRQLAGSYGLPVTIGKMDVGAACSPRLGRNRGGDAAPTTTEDACRRARFAFFEQVAQKTGIHTLALAHTADDQAETVLMRLIRGAGVTGLSGIWPERRIGRLTVVRPLLGVTRKEVLKYLSAHGLKWREDASNRDTRFLRNRVRHELLPLLEREYNPKIRDVLRRTAEVFRAEAAGEPAAAERRAIRQLSFAQVEELRKLARKVDLSRLTGGWELKLDGKTKIKELGASFVVAAASSPRLARFNRGGDAAPTTECFDAAILGKQLFVRTWRAGDRFQPLGMKGEKKLQDFFVDEKVPRERRGRVPLLCAADGRIAWVVGYRIAEPFKVTPRTKRVLRIRFEGC